jgi:hypothetical protein
LNASPVAGEPSFNCVRNRSVGDQESLHAEELRAVSVQKVLWYCVKMNVAFNRIDVGVPSTQN